MLRFLNALRAPFSWHRVDGAGGPVWAYWENAVTGRRGAVRCGPCYQPLNWPWLKGGVGEPVIWDEFSP